MFAANMRILLATITVLTTLASNGQIAVYKNHITQANNGATVTWRKSLAGYTVLDLQTGNASIIYADPKTKHFFVYTTSWNVVVVSGATAKEYTVYNYSYSTSDQYGAPTFDAAWLKGANVAHTDIGDTNSLWRIPKTLSYTEKYVYSANETDSILEEDSGTFTIDLVTTRAYNSTQTDLTTATNALSQKLITLGYTQD